MRTLVLILFPLTLFSQSGGESTYQFLNNPISARSAGLGGKVISLKNGDLGAVEDNPALLDSNLVKNLSLNYINFISDINYGYVGYANTIKKWGVVSAGLQYMNYGDFIRADHTGNQLGEFTAAEYALNVSYAKQFDSTFSVGSTLKHIFSDLDSYQSFGVAIDMGGYYRARNGLFSAGLVFSNIGSQLVTYTENNKERLPFRIDLGITQKLGHAPLRLSFTARNLESIGTLDGIEFSSNNLLNHVVIGVEILPSDNFFVVIGYNQKRRQDLKIDSKPGLSGISFGAGLKISKFSISFSRATYHLGGASGHLTVTTNLSHFKRKTNGN